MFGPRNLNKNFFKLSQAGKRRSQNGWEMEDQEVSSWLFGFTKGANLKRYAGNSEDFLPIGNYHQGFTNKKGERRWWAHPRKVASRNIQA